MRSRIDHNVGGQKTTVSDLVQIVRLQGTWCTKLGSPFYGFLLEKFAENVDAVQSIFAGYPHEPIASAMVLRLMGAIHRRVLSGELSSLVTHYPSAGGDGSVEKAWPAFCLILDEQADVLRAEIASVGVQTNEVGRALALLSGFLEFGRSTDLPLRCLEVGSSAGLNLRWDAFRYQIGSRLVGAVESRVCLSTTDDSVGWPLDFWPSVVERVGCDTCPLDLTKPTDRLSLASFIWPDQPERLALLYAASVIAERIPAEVQKADASDWAIEKLSECASGTATVLFHSIVLQYLDEQSRASFLAAIAEAGARATSKAPFAWLRMEPGGDQAEVRLTCWPGGVERLVATTGFHGQNVRRVAH